MRPRSRQARVGQRVRRGLAALALAAVALLAASPVAAETPPVPSPSPEAPLLPVTVTLGTLRPLAPQPGQTLRITGTLHNISADPVGDLQVHLSVSSSRVGSRGEFDGYADTPDGPAPADAVAVAPEEATVTRTDLPVGGTARFRLEVGVDELALPTAWQVYELALSATGTTPLGTITVGRLRTFLPWAPVNVPGVGLPTRVAWVWPLVDRPHRVGASQWRDDELARELAGDGRLAGLLRAGIAAQNQRPAVTKPTVKHRGGGKKGDRRPAKPPPPPRPTISPVPVTWAVDPLLVEGVARMADGYDVGLGDDPQPGEGQQAAKSWLSSLEAAMPAGELLALPYADPDVTATVHAGLTNDVQVAANAGQLQLKDALGKAPLAYAWPPGGYLDQRTLDALFASGVTTVVLDSAALPVVGASSKTPGAHARVTGRDYGDLDALLADHTLTRVAETGAADPAQSRLAIQRLVSELLMIQAELPSYQRSLVIAPDRRWAPTPGYAATVLAAMGRVPWVEPVPLSAVVDAPVPTDVERGPHLVFPAAARAAELPRGYLADVRDLQRRVDAFTDILPDLDPQARELHAALLRLLSSAWRTDLVTARASLDALDDQVADRMGEVSIALHRGSLITLTSHSGIVPVTVENGLDVPVRIRVDIDPSAHLQVKGGPATKTIPAHTKAPVDVRAVAQTSGVFPLTVTLRTPGGRQYGDERVQLLVKSTAYGTTALLITGGAFAVLLLAVAVRLSRRVLAARRASRAA